MYNKCGLRVLENGIYRFTWFGMLHDCFGINLVVGRSSHFSLLTRVRAAFGVPCSIPGLGQIVSQSV